MSGVLPPPKRDSRDDRLKKPRPPLTLRIDRAAGDINPFLLLFAVGLIVLDLTLYVGLSASWSSASYSAAPPAAHAAAPTRTGWGG